MKTMNGCLHDMAWAVFITACSVFTVAAETNIPQLADNDLTLMKIDELMKIDIVGSTLIEENMNSVPSSVTVYTGEEIRRMGIHNLEELSMKCGGIYRFISNHIMYLIRIITRHQNHA